MSTEARVKNGLQSRYPSLDISEQFQTFIDEEEYDSDLIQADIMEDQEILEWLLSKNPNIDSDELNQSLQDILNKSLKKDEDELNNAEEHTNNDSHILLQPPTMLQSITSASNISSPSPSHSHISPVSSSQFTPYLYNLHKKDTETVRQLMQKYCPSLLAKSSNPNNLIYLHTICYTTKKPFFSWIMDTFDRFKIDYKRENIDPLYLSQMCAKFGTYLEELSDKNQMDFNSIIAYAMHEYNMDILHGLDFKPKYKICDNYYQFVSNVFGLNKVVKKLVCDDNIYPFQLDVWLVPHTIVHSDDFEAFEEKKQCGDIEETLLEIDYGEEYYEHELREYEDANNDKLYVFSLANHNRMVEFIEDSFAGKEIVNIAKNMRYVLMIDRRHESSEHDGYCLIHMHQDSVGEHCYFDQQYFEKSQNCLFGTEDEEEANWSLYENNAHIFGLSYHVLDKNTVKMYWNVGNKKSRFLMSDLYNVWPLYFDEKLNDFSVLDGIAELLDEDNYNVPDVEFNAFYQCITKTQQKEQIIMNEKWRISSVPNAELMEEVEEEKNVELKEENSFENEEEILSEDVDMNEAVCSRDNISSQSSQISSQSQLSNAYNSNYNNIDYVENENGNYHEQHYEHEYKKQDNEDVDEEKKINNPMTAMKEWLREKDFTRKYSAQHLIFESTLKELWDDGDDDFEVDCVFEELLPFNDGDIDNSEILTTIRDDEHCKEQDFNAYISGLIDSLKEYIAINDDDEAVEYDDLEDKVEDIGNKYGGGGNIKTLYKVNNKHFSFYCCGDCKNNFARFIFCDITKQQKLEILSNYFWSFDYELRQHLIQLLTEYYDGKQSENINNLLSELNGPNVFIDNDEKWINMFVNVLNERNGDILLSLSQLTCHKKGNNLIRELRENIFDINNNNKDIMRRLQININKIRNNLNRLNLNIHLTNDEISVLYIIANDNLFNILRNIESASCQWKSFHFNVISAINKLKKHRYHFEIPNNLYCYASNIKNNSNLNSYLNQITLWHSDLSQQQKYMNDKNTILHLQNIKHLKNNIQIIPIEWIVSADKENNNLFLVLPLTITKLSCVTKRPFSDSICQYVIPSKANYKSIEIITL